ncbi:MAG TPA: PfkB family carbohydrate kinase [Gemmataceae bacterium]|nr:PfkB family carbohydrate kinase [Gemmataceae bacterium]
MPPAPPEIPPAIAVFSPTPLLTVTIEARSDGGPELHIHAGGQGFWVARMVARLGVPVTLCAPFGGDTGRLLKTLVAAEDVQLCGVEIAGSNGSYVHDRRSGERVEICSVEGAKLNRHEADDLYGATFAAALDSGLLVLTGQYPVPVVPSKVYRRLAHDLRENGRRVIADLSGDDLAEALHGGIDVLSFSHEELVRQGYAGSDRPEELVAGLDALQQRGATQIIVHRGAKPTIARLDGRLLEVITPKVDPLDHRGGGDTFFAALAAGLARQQDLEETVRFAAAAGTLNVTRHGLGTGRLEDIVALSQHVRIRPLGEAA